MNDPLDKMLDREPDSMTLEELQDALDPKPDEDEEEDGDYWDEDLEGVYGFV